MASLCNSSCTVEFRPKAFAGSNSTENNWNRAVAEVLQNDDNPNSMFSMRAIDLTRQKKVIFDLPFSSIDLYKFGVSATIPDEIQCGRGVYTILLNEASHDNFHTILNSCFELSKSMGISIRTANKDGPTQSPPTPSKPSPVQPSPTLPIATEADHLRKDPKEVLDDLQKLEQYIKQGQTQEARKLMESLKKAGVPFQLKNEQELSNDRKISIRVKIDGTDPSVRDQDKAFTMEMYESARVSELRALFAYTHGFSVADQYFFVNGHLAHDEAIMRDFCGDERSLYFILFVIQAA